MELCFCILNGVIPIVMAHFISIIQKFLLPGLSLPENKNHRHISLSIRIIAFMNGI